MRHLFREILDMPTDGGWIYSHPEPENYTNLGFEGDRNEAAKRAANIVENMETMIAEGETILKSLAENKRDYVSNPDSYAVRVLSVEVMVRLAEFIKKSAEAVLDVNNPEWEWKSFMLIVNMEYVAYQQDALNELIKRVA